MKVIALPEVEQYLEHLKYILFEYEYFSFEENAHEYVDTLFDDIITTLPLRRHKPAPPQFDRYGEGMKYAAFKKNRRTTWYVFFQTYEDDGEIYYLVRYIDNNHRIAQYFKTQKIFLLVQQPRDGQVKLFPSNCQP